MQVTVEEKNTVCKILHIEVPEKEVSSQLDSAYKELKKTSNIKGFRQGKVPRSVLERMFKKDVHQDVVSKLIQTSFYKAVTDNKLHLVGEPQINPPELTPGEDYKYDATVDIKPVISDLDYKGIKLTKTKYSVSDEEVEAQLEMLRKNAAKKESIKDDRPSQIDDFVLIDYQGFVDGKEFEAAPEIKNSIVKLGSSHVGKEFDEQVAGMNKNEEKEFEIDFPEDYVNKGLAGNKINYKVKLTDIREEVLPEIDDTFAKTFGEYDTLEDLKSKIVENLMSGYEKRIEQEMNEQIFTHLIEETDFEIPESMVKYELDHILKEAEQAFAGSNMSMEQIGETRETLAEKYRDVAVKQVRRHLLLGKLIEQEEMSIDDDELEAGYQNLSESYGQPVDYIRKFYQENQDKVEFFKHTLLEKKMINLVVENGEVEEIEPVLEKAEEAEEAVPEKK